MVLGGNFRSAAGTERGKLRSGFLRGGSRARAHNQ